MQSTFAFRFAVVAFMLLVALSAAAENGFMNGQPEATTATTLTVGDRYSTFVGEPISSGYVIIGGCLLGRPYRVSRRGSDVLINGQVFAALQDAREVESRNGFSEKGFTPERLAATIERRLTLDECLIAFDDRTYVCSYPMDIAYLLDALIKAQSLEERIRRAVEGEYNLAADEAIPISSSQWRQALANFEPTENLVRFVEQTAIDENYYGEDLFAVESWKDDFGQTPTTTHHTFALNVAGMLMVAVSLGILLSNPPPKCIGRRRVVDTDEANNLVVKCLALIFVLSILDLACTLVAGTTSEFKELNPLAASLISSPIALLAFKLALTALGISLLWFYRKHVVAQRASWWACLVLTLVIARWVVVQSSLHA